MRLLSLKTRKGRNGEVIQASVMVDDEDYEDLSRYTWYLKIDNANDPKKRHVSVGRHSTQGDKHHLSTSLVLMNRHILKLDDPSIVVHFKDKDPLNMQKKNLQVILNGHQLLKLLRHWQELTTITVKTEIER